MAVAKHAGYARYVARHKWFVLRAGLQTGAPLWRLIIHDYTKLSRAEWGPYAARFFGGRAGVEDKVLDPDEFKRAWKHHYEHNPHHWNHWVNDSVQYGVRTAGCPPYPREMPEHFVREMVADWMGAGRAITGAWGIDEWWSATAPHMTLHPATRTLAAKLVAAHALRGR